MSSEIDANLADLIISLQTWCEKTARMASGKTFEEFQNDETLQLALSMAVAQIGEVSGRILRKWPDFAAQRQSLELGNAAAMRNRLIHVYDQIELPILWDTVATSIPEMLSLVLSILRERGAVEP